MVNQAGAYTSRNRLDFIHFIHGTEEIEIMQARILDRNRKRTTGAFIAAVLTFAFCMGAAPEVNAAGAVSLDDLPAVVARVNGTPVPKSAVVPEEGETIAAAVRHAVDQELVAQQFVKEGLDKDPGYQRQISRKREDKARRTRQETTALANFYEKSIPELASKPDPTKVTEAEIDEWLTGDTVILGSLTGQQARDAVRKLVSRGKKAAARGEWLKARLAKAKVRVYGKRVPQAAIAAGVAEMSNRRIGSREKPKTPLRDKIREMIIGGEARLRGVAPETIAKDAVLVEELFSAAEIEVDGDIMYPSMLMSLPRALGQFLLAAEARKKGVDKDPEYQKKFTESFPPMPQEMVTHEALLRAEIFYARHGLSPVDAKISDAELNEWYLALMRALVSKKSDGEQDSLRSQLRAVKLRWMRQGAKPANVADTNISDAELDRWYIAIIRGLANGEKSSLRGDLNAAKLRWMRDGYLESLRQTAKIEYMAELE